MNVAILLLASFFCQDDIAELKERIARLEKIIEKQEKRIVELEEKLAFVKLKKKKKDVEPLVYTEWNAWKDFPVGATVTYKLSDTPQLRMWQRYTLTKKAKDTLTLKVESRMDMAEKIGKWKSAAGQDPKTVKKPTKWDSVTECAACKKPVEDHKKPTYKNGEAQVAGKKVKTTTLTAYKCDGTFAIEMPFSREVPGWMINMGGAERPVTHFDSKPGD